MGVAAEQVHRVLHELRWPVDDFFVGGSGVLALRDIRPIGSDLDLGVTTGWWCHLLRAHYGPQYAARFNMDLIAPASTDPERRCDPPFLRLVVQDINVDVFFAWRRRGAHETPFNDYNLVFREGIEMVHGWPCLKLPILLQQKVDAVSHPQPRDKDIADIALISHYMAEEEEVVA